MTAREVLVLFLRAEDLETLHERQAGVDHHRELAREDGEVLGGDGLGRELLRRRLGGLLLDRVDLRDEDLLAPQRRDRGVHRVRQRSPVTVCPARVRPLYANVAIVVLTHLPAGRSCRLPTARPPAARGAPARPRPAPATTPTPRLIMSCSSSRFEDGAQRVSRA